MSWGPNNTFRYPLRGGTGFLYEGLRRFVEDHLELETPVASVDPVAKDRQHRGRARVAVRRPALDDAAQPAGRTASSRVPDAVRAGGRRAALERQPHRRRRHRPAGGQHQELDLLPGAGRAVLPGHLPVELLALHDRRGRTRRCSSPRRRGRAQARGRRRRSSNGSSTGWSPPSSMERATGTRSSPRGCARRT